MDLHNFLRSRRSVRHFKPNPVSDPVIHRILKTASYAPSAHNRQPWRFVVLTHDDIKKKLADAMALDFRRDLERDNLSEDEIINRINKSRTRITSSPVIIVLCMDISDMDIYHDALRGNAERIMAVQSAANAGMQLLLAAHAEGLGCVWTCSPLFTPDTVRTLFNLSASWEPQAMYLVGYPADSPKQRERKSIQEISIFL